MTHAKVPREAEVLVEIVGLLAQAHPLDRHELAKGFRAEALHECLDVPPVEALVWLSGRLGDQAGGAARGNSRECVEPVARAVPVPSGSGA